MAIHSLYEQLKSPILRRLLWKIHREYNESERGKKIPSSMLHTLRMLISNKISEIDCILASEGIVISDLDGVPNWVNEVPDGD